MNRFKLLLRFFIRFADLLPNIFLFVKKGHCPCCEQRVTFIAGKTWLRDYFICNKCLSIPRERALMMVLNNEYPEWRRMNIHESSPGRRGASLKIGKECKNYTSSQYFPDQPAGKIVSGFRNENLEAQSYSDESFDIVITQDVMEHIYNPREAFAEIARTLKKGGAHIFTVPLINKHKKSQIWAKIGKDGRPVFTHEPEYHRNPVDPKGSPVTMHWGYDIVNFIKKSSGLSTQIFYINDLEYGISGEFMEVLVSHKDNL